MAEEMRRESTTMGTAPPTHGGGTYGGGYGYGGPTYGGPPYTTFATGTPDKPPFFKRISWGAIFAGTFITLALGALLWTLGLAVGFAAVTPEGLADPATAWGFGIWGIVVAIVSLFCGGLVAAWLAGLPKWFDAMIHGVVVWGLATTAAMLLAVGGMTLATAGVAAVAGPQQIAGLPMQPMMGVMDPWDHDPRETVRDELAGILPTEDDWFLWEEPRHRYTDREIDTMVRFIEQGRHEQILGVLIEDGNLDRREAEQRLTRWERDLQRPDDRFARPDERIFATPEPTRMPPPDRQALDMMTNLATWSFFALLLGAAAAAVGGTIGRPQYVETHIMTGGHPRYTPPGYHPGGPTEYREYRGGEPGRYQPPPSY